MLPLIPAILLLLLHGPSSFERFPQDARLPETWNALHRSASDTSDEAMLARLLALATGQATISATTAVKVESTADEPPGSLGHLWIAPRLAEACQDCRRSRDGPDSIA